MYKQSQNQTLKKLDHNKISLLSYYFCYFIKYIDNNDIPTTFVNKNKQGWQHSKEAKPSKIGFMAFKHAHTAYESSLKISAVYLQ